MTLLLIAAVILVLLALRQSVFVILGSVALLSYLLIGDPLQNLVVDAWDGLNREILLSIPLYILAGNIMARGAIAARLVRLMRALTEAIPGGLAIATVLSCAMFAAVTGSGTVTLLAVGAVLYPALLEAGYPRAFALGALCAGGTLGVIIPPSIPLILYGVMTQTSIADLFIAGIGPGLLLTALMSLYAVFVARGRARGHWDWQEVRAAFSSGIWALLMPLLIMGGIYSGHFTPTESAAVAVVYAVLVETLIHREIGLRDLVAVTADTTRLLGSLFPVLMMALSLNVLLTYQQVPEMLVTWLGSRIDNPATLLLGTNVFLLLVGCFMDIGSAILVLAPMLAPLAVEQGFSPVHFGIIMVMNLEIGYLTPPMGLNLIVAMTAFRADFRTLCLAVLPFVAIMLTGLAIVSLWPALSLFLIAGNG